MNDENEDSIRNTLVAAFNKIYVDHGVCITSLTAEWLDLRSCKESKKLLTFLEIKAEL